MNKTAISWASRSWNPAHGCSKVSDGCKHCYAMTLSLEKGWTKSDWTIQNEAENVLLKPHKLAEPYTLTEPERVFVNSMSDMFHRAIPDWYRAVVFAIMLDLPQHVFQVLTKRSESLQSWDARFIAAVRSDEFKQFAETVKNKKVKAALDRATVHLSPWAGHIWQGVSVEDRRVLHRIDDLRRSNAHVKFISAEPLLGAWGADVDLSGIDWVIVGGESGKHMVTTDETGERVENERRWMKDEWAREIKRLCVDQRVAFFFKQGSAYNTEQHKYLIEEDGSKWEWNQYPGALIPPREVGNPKSLFGNWDHKTEGTSFSLRSYIAHLWENRAYQFEGFRAENAAVAAAWWYRALEEFRPALPSAVVASSATTDPASVSQFKQGDRHAMNADPDPIAPLPPAAQTTVVHFQQVYQHWDKQTRTWDNPRYVYIGRYVPSFNLPGSLFANPFKIATDTPANRAAAIEQYRAWIAAKLDDPEEGAKYRAALEGLRGKTIACWCKDPNGDPAKSKACHGDVLVEMLGETSEQPADPPKPAREEATVQLSLFDMKTYA